MTEKKSLAVVILNWNSAERTLACLEMLYEIQTEPFDIFMVDNGSTDGSLYVVSERFPKVTILKNKTNLGFGGGCNVALQKILCLPGNEDFGGKTSNYEYVLLLNTDAGIDEQCLQELVDSLEKNKEVGVIGPVILDKNDRQHILASGGLDPALHINTYSRSLQVSGKAEEISQVEYVSGTVALLRTDVLSKIGLFDEGYFFSCEMADLCMRIKREGYKCVVTPQAEAWHDMTEAGVQRDTLYTYYSLRNRFLYIRKFYRKSMLVLFGFWIFVGCYAMMKALLSKRYQRFRALGQALRDGVLGSYGGRNFLFDKAG